jgi:mRNA interferase MazF
MVVVSREDEDPPRALVIFVPVTTKFRGSAYEVDIGKQRFLREQSYVNCQAVMAVQVKEILDRVGKLPEAEMDKVRAALKYSLDLS